MVELVDTRDSKPRSFGSAGSIPATGTSLQSNDGFSELVCTMDNKQIITNLEDKIAKLETENTELKQQKKYGLVWEDKPEAFDEQSQQAYPVLSKKADKKYPDINKPSSKGNQQPHILIEGDNYHTLSVLNVTHQKKIDVIYIDPPYNTGARDWKYNNDYVGKDDEYRHSKWLSFMEKRLKLAKNILSPSGIICVTIDDCEMPRLWLLMETIFSEFNHLGSVVIRNNPKGRMTKRKFSLVHEYALFFGCTKNSSIKKLPVVPSQKSHNYKKDTDGTWYLPVNLRKQGVDSNALNKKGKLSNRYYPIYFDPKTEKVSLSEKLKIKILPNDTEDKQRIWRKGKDVIDKMYKNGDLWVKKTKHDYQVYFKFRGGLDGRLSQSVWYDSIFSASDYGTRTLDKILGEREIFQYPKATGAVKEAILACSNKQNAIVLDFFAGSGTTAHAVLELNKEDGGNRQCILATNNENGICEDITYQRVKRVIEGYTTPKGKVVEGIGGALHYLKTDFVPKEKMDEITDNDKIIFSYRVGVVLALKENTFNEIKANDSYQIFTSEIKATGIYFSENTNSLCELIDFLVGLDKPCRLYSYPHLSTDDFTEFDNITLTEIPNHILKIYQTIGVI